MRHQHLTMKFLLANIVKDSIVLFICNELQIISQIFLNKESYKYLFAIQ